MFSFHVTFSRYSSEVLAEEELDEDVLDEEVFDEEVLDEDVLAEEVTFSVIATRSAKESVISRSSLSITTV